ncbi:hypothetical protein QIW53_04620 [Pseudomonas fluorescens]|jgi:hypothetical protein
MNLASVAGKKKDQGGITAVILRINQPLGAPESTKKSMAII